MKNEMKKLKIAKLKILSTYYQCIQKKMTSQGDLFQVQGFEVQRSV